jgi:hypothetical protein
VHPLPSTKEIVSEGQMPYLLTQIPKPSKAIIEIISPGQSVYKFDSVIKRCVVSTLNKKKFFV